MVETEEHRLRKETLTKEFKCILNKDVLTAQDLTNSNIIIMMWNKYNYGR